MFHNELLKMEFMKIILKIKKTRNVVRYDYRITINYD